MAQVPEKVLAWLYSVLHEYRDPQRTYSDAARTLAAYSSLSPRTEVYSFENGSTALLLTLSGTLPVNFRGTTYRFPIQLWVPHSYPQEAPFAYVNPGRDMIIRPGQHVSVDGRIYHPYLRDWSMIWDRASIAEFLEFLQQVFAKEPPVISKAQQQQYQRSIGQPQPQQQPGASPAPPQLPPKQKVGSAGPAEMSSGQTPPPRPPKPGEEQFAQHPPRTSSRDSRRDGPPLPPLPHESPANQQHSSQLQNGYGAPALRQPQVVPSQAHNHQNGRPPGPTLTPLPRQQGPPQQGYQPQQRPYERSPVSPVSPMNGHSGLPETTYSQPASLPPQQLQPYQRSNVQSYPGPQYTPHQAPYHQQPPRQMPPQQQYPANQVYPQHLPPQQPPQPKKQPPPDLLSDPFDIALPGSSSSSRPPAPAPPIPPNPEKEHLLHALSASLVQQVQQKVNQNLSAIAPLQAQQNALRAAHERFEAEIRQLEQLDKTLASNEAILRRSIQECDHTIETAKSKPPPPIDDVLIAPTMVANQLWTLCAEEAACKEAMYVLQKAVVRGRVSGNDFVRQMRSLGRECFLKMVLAKKCARGLGLEMNGR
ncbi:Suppressor protein stp22 of temperature-sensitive alpha-factor receptor and arginine permease [Vermiconidia calcicola]|uniref:Suppressor protein stp22 of temperature-sensitive alpha-factor receptor and arginine permease n=1 Tax=Vermiconidia calcicola TaxID=1690605 RepID=A0ACC3MPM3_9PEZI|nr:Suppressor protein stp22 of temperature-sensitive alpha-factor receptor and arginine permease [Vermiconidia calcicola]